MWRWQGHTSIEGGAPADRFDQSTFAGFPWKPGRIAGMADTAVPERSERNEAARFVVDLLGRGQTLGAIADSVARAFPGSFPTAWSAKDFVRKLIRLCEK